MWGLHVSSLLMRSPLLFRWEPEKICGQLFCPVVCSSEESGHRENFELHTSLAATTRGFPGTWVDKMPTSTLALLMIVAKHFPGTQSISALHARIAHAQEEFCLASARNSCHWSLFSNTVLGHKLEHQGVFDCPSILPSGSNNDGREMLWTQNKLLAPTQQCLTSAPPHVSASLLSFERCCSKVSLQGGHMHEVMQCQNCSLQKQPIHKNF